MKTHYSLYVIKLKRKFTTHFNYNTTFSFLLGIFSILFWFTERERVFPQLQLQYFIVKMSSAVMAFISFFLYLRKQNEPANILIIINSIFYVLTNIWFGPIYEISYLQLSIACAFLDLKNKWIYTLFFAIGLVGIYLTYYIQHQINWQKPEPEIIDWISTVFVFFLIGFFVQKFAISQYQSQISQNLKLQLIGYESSKLLHDFKGMISTPVLKIHQLQKKGSNQNDINFQEQLQSIANDLISLTDQIKYINQLIIPDESKQVFYFNTLLEKTIQSLKARLVNIEVQKPIDSIKIESYQNRLQSVLFNLILNSINAFQYSKQISKSITLEWKKNKLIYKDNAGISLSNAPLNTGLGLKMIEYDLKKMNCEFEYEITDIGSVFKITFSPKNIL